VAHLTGEQKDVLIRVLDAGIQRASDELNEMLTASVLLRILSMDALPPPELAQRVEAELHHSDLACAAPLSAVRLAFTGSAPGAAWLILTRQQATNLVLILTNDNLPSPDLNAIRIGTLIEIGNIVLSGVMNEIISASKMPLFRVQYRVPQYTDDPKRALAAAMQEHPDGTAVWTKIQFHMFSLPIDSSVILFFNPAAFDTLLAALTAPNHNTEIDP
jgi:chemotaxis protein CheC